MDAPLVAGQAFAERYRVERELGRGGMGAVYRVHDLVLDEPIALKVLGVLTPESLARFRREVRLARRVSHRNVVRTFDIGVHEGVAYVALELIDGDSLQQRLRARTRLPLDEVAPIGAAVAAGLHAAHAAGVLHRDLKPGNIVIARDGRVVLIDFGIAVDVVDNALEQPASIAGTFDYLSPEQLAGGVGGPEADVYALGATLFVALTGAYPFAGASPTERAAARLVRDPMPIGALADLPPDVGTLIMRCLSRDPVRRPAPLEIERILSERADPFAGRPTEAHALPWQLTSVAQDDASATTPDGFAETASLPALRTLLVRPFLAAHDDIGVGAAFADELADVLMRTRGLRVVAAHAAGLGADIAGVEAATRTGADSVVEGAIETHGTRLRITARLFDGVSGARLWAESTEIERSHALPAAQRIAARIAESLRLELALLDARASIPAAALDATLEARRLLRAQDAAVAERALALLDDALAAAPAFALAAGTRALAAARMWFLPALSGARAVDDAVALALDVAAGLPETHLAAATVAFNRCEHEAARNALEAALALAPTYAPALELLGTIACEAGRAAEGVAHLKHALHIEPTALPPLLVLARSYALLGMEADATRVLGALARRSTPLAAGPVLLRLRIASWRREHDAIRALRTELARAGAAAPLLDAVARAACGEPARDLPAILDEALEGVRAVPRLAATLHELATDLFAASQPERALTHLERLTDLGSVHVLWLTHSPLLAPLRGEPRFTQCARALVRRAHAVSASSAADGLTHARALPTAAHVATAAERPTTPGRPPPRG